MCGWYSLSMLRFDWRLSEGVERLPRKIVVVWLMASAEAAASGDDDDGFEPWPYVASHYQESLRYFAPTIQVSSSATCCSLEPYL